MFVIGGCNCGKPQWSVVPIPCPVHGFPQAHPPCPCRWTDPSHSTHRIYVSTNSG